MIRLVAIRKLFLPFLTLSIPWTAVCQAQFTNKNPPPRPAASKALGASVLLDDIIEGGFLRACVGSNGALGAPPCPDIDFGMVGLRLDPDGAAGPLVESEDSNEGSFEERWCVEHDAQGSVCNAVFATGLPGFDQTDTSTAGQHQSTGHLTTPDGRLRIDQVVTLRNESRCVEIDLTLKNVGATALTNVEYLRNHDPDLGIQINNDFSTDNQTINRPLPGAAPPMIVAASVQDFSPVETRSIGLGTNVLPPAGVRSDVSIHRFGLVHDDPDPILDGSSDITRGFFAGDVGNAIAFRIASLVPGESEDLSLCYCMASTRANIGADAVAADLSEIFSRECGIVQVILDIKPEGFPNSINPRSKGVIPVAILSTASFDATEIDVSTLRFGPGGATEAHGKGHLEDVDRDGDLDLVLHFSTTSARILCGSTEAAITGETLDGRRIEGTDSVRTTGCR